jgi:membrane peptidoglycan carboxypeptidase
LKEWFMSGTWWRRWTWRKALAVVAGAGLTVVVLGAAAFLVAYAKTPIPTDANAAALAEPSQAYYSNHRLIASFSNGGVNRQILSAAQIPPIMNQAIIAAEDRHFYTEGGISPTGLLRAAYEDLKGGNVDQGGSTLTEQFVKNYYTGFASANNSDKSANDKFKQILVAIKLAHSKSKPWILTQYLNTVYFGQNAYGVGAAAETYFGKRALKLDVAQAAMLAAMVNQPSFFNPNQKADPAGYAALHQRWEYVLEGMVKDGQLTRARASVIEAHFPAVHYHFTTGWNGAKGYIMQMVQQELEKTYGLSQAKLDSGGLKIYTTINKSMMTGLADAVKQNKELMAEGGKALPSYAHIGGVLEQPGTGDILAVYGGPGWSSNTKACDRVSCEYDMAEAPESVGSSFKPYVLAAAVGQQMNVQDSVLNGFSPLYIPPDWSADDQMELASQVKPADDFGWTHFDEASENTGPTGVAEAAAISSDPAFLDLAHRVGVDKVLSMARQFGIGGNPLNANNANDMTGLENLYGPHGTKKGDIRIALGLGALTTVEQATTFATLANDGQYATGHVVSRIVQGTGTVPIKVLRSAPLNAAQAADVDYALSFDNQSKFPGATAFPNAAWDRPVIAKTGTLGNGDFASEAWFNGAIPQYSLSISLFTDKQSQNIDGLGGIPEGFGGTWPAKIWHTFMSTQFASLPVEPLPTPDFVGFLKWNQVNGNTSLTPTASPTPTASAPVVTPTPSATPTCTPGFGQVCIPGDGGSPSPPVTSSPSPNPTCTPGFGNPCVGTSPSTPPGRGNNIPAAMIQPAEAP